MTGRQMTTQNSAGECHVAADETDNLITAPLLDDDQFVALVGRAAQTLYDHPLCPDTALQYDAKRARLSIINEVFEYGVPMGPSGLVQTGEAMVALGQMLLIEEASKCA